MCHSKENAQPLTSKILFSPNTEQKDTSNYSATGPLMMIPPFRIRPRNESGSKRRFSGRKYEHILTS